MNTDDAALVDLLLAARDVLTFAEGKTRKTLQRDEMCRSAVLYKFAIIGEAVRRLSTGFKESHPQIPWVQIAGMRNRVIHEYHRVDVGEVWRTIQQDIPTLVQAIEAVAPKPGRQAAEDN